MNVARMFLTHRSIPSPPQGFNLAACTIELFPFFRSQFLPTNLHEVDPDSVHLCTIVHLCAEHG